MLRFFVRSRNLAGTENWENVGELHGLPAFVSYCPVVISLILRPACRMMYAKPVAE